MIARHCSVYCSRQQRHHPAAHRCRYVGVCVLMVITLCVSYLSRYVEIHREKERKRERERGYPLHLQARLQPRAVQLRMQLGRRRAKARPESGTVFSRRPENEPSQTWRLLSAHSDKPARAISVPLPDRAGQVKLVRVLSHMAPGPARTGQCVSTCAPYCAFR